MRSPEPAMRKLVTIFCEAAIEDALLRDLESLGAHGYTVTDARGKGSGGRRDAAWGPHANIRVEVLCSDDTAGVICQALRQRYYDDYAMVLFVAEVEVLRPDKF